MRAVVSVVVAPGGDQLAVLGQAGEQVLVEALVPQPAMEAFEVKQANAIGPRDPATDLHLLRPIPP